ncbi:hypothetical protein KPMX200_40642 [Klebsiella pneumoniae]|nr:hypothetical protein KPMX200_40642 [Klebsiella pneumoniae]
MPVPALPPAHFIPARHQQQYPRAPEYNLPPKQLRVDGRPPGIRFYQPTALARRDPHRGQLQRDIAIAGIFPVDQPQAGLIMNNIAGMDVHVQRRQPQGTGLALAAQPLMPAQPTRLAPRRIAPLPVLGQQWCEANPPAKPRLLMQIIQ